MYMCNMYLFLFSDYLWLYRVTFLYNAVFGFLYTFIGGYIFSFIAELLDKGNIKNPNADLLIGPVARRIRKQNSNSANVIV